MLSGRERITAPSLAPPTVDLFENTGAYFTTEKLSHELRKAAQPLTRFRQFVG